MKFTDCESSLTDDQIQAFEKELALTFPIGLRRHFGSANGGRPEPYIYRDENVDAVISECLPLRYGKGSALSVYENLVIAKKLLPQHFFPFAVDAGGDVFFVDCLSSDGSVYVYQHDTAFEHLVHLGVSIDDFWLRLVTE